MEGSRRDAIHPVPPVMMPVPPAPDFPALCTRKAPAAGAAVPTSRYDRDPYLYVLVLRRKPYYYVVMRFISSIAV